MTPEIITILTTIGITLGTGRLATVLWVTGRFERMEKSIAERFERSVERFELSEQRSNARFEHAERNSVRRFEQLLQGWCRDPRAGWRNSRALSKDASRAGVRDIARPGACRAARALRLSAPRDVDADGSGGHAIVTPETI